LLQLDERAVHSLHNAGFEIAIETNGTIAPPRGIDWICCSPKGGAKLALRSGHELKFVYPQEDLNPDEFVGLDFCHFFLQPMDGPERDTNTRMALEYCLRHPRWRLSLQIHKLLGIP
jgi:organic radical activating enzyme